MSAADLSYLTLLSFIHLVVARYRKKHCDRHWYWSW